MQDVVDSQSVIRRGSSEPHRSPAALLDGAVNGGGLGPTWIPSCNLCCQLPGATGGSWWPFSAPRKGVFDPGLHKELRLFL